MPHKLESICGSSDLNLCRSAGTAKLCSQIYLIWFHTHPLLGFLGPSLGLGPQDLVQPCPALIRPHGTDPEPPWLSSGPERTRPARPFPLRVNTPYVPQLLWTVTWTAAQSTWPGSRSTATSLLRTLIHSAPRSWCQYNASEFFYNINVPTNIFSQGYVDMELECPSAMADIDFITNKTITHIFYKFYHCGWGLSLTSDLTLALPIDDDDNNNVNVPIRNH